MCWLLVAGWRVAVWACGRVRVSASTSASAFASALTSVSVSVPVCRLCLSLCVSVCVFVSYDSYVHLFVNLVPGMSVRANIRLHVLQGWSWGF